MTSYVYDPYLDYLMEYHIRTPFYKDLLDEDWDDEVKKIIDGEIVDGQEKE